MKLVTYQNDSGDAVGGFLTRDDQGVIPLTEIDSRFDSVQAFIESGVDSSIVDYEVLERQPARVPIDRVHLLSPLPRPIQIRDVLCFLDHMRNAGRRVAKLQGADPDDYVLPSVYESAPRYYKANRMCVIGTDQDIVWPEGCNFLDYELELGIIVGKQGKDILREEARDYVFGYTIFNDVSAGDIQMTEMESGLGPAKG